MNPEMIELLNRQCIELLKRYAKTKCFYDLDLEAEEIGEYFGGDTDEAFSVGEATGTTMLARKILDSMGIEYDCA